MFYIVLLLIIFYIIFNVIIIPVILLVNDSWDDIKTFPAEIHKNSSMNWFGAVLSSIIIFIFIPFVCFVRFVYWLCHVHVKRSNQND